jgi:hypothetical protein
VILQGKVRIFTHSFRFSNGVVAAEVGTALKKKGSHLQGWRIGEVIGVGLEGEAKDADGFPLEGAKGLLQSVDDVLTLAGVHAEGGAEHGHLASVVCGEAQQSSDVLGQTRAAPADSGIEIMRAYAVIKAYAFGNSSDIGAQLLGQASEFVDERELCDEEGIGGIFDEFGIAGSSGEH